MSLTSRMAVALLILSITSAARAQTPTPARAPQAPKQAAKPARETVKLADRSVRTTATTTFDNAKSTSATINTPEPEPASDPYGFAAHFNYYRAVAGLPPVSYDPNLSNWASHNNVAQTRRGLGHFVNPNCFQNCAWNITDAATAAQMWMNSTGHRENMLSPNISRFGIAYGPGPYWTLNAQ